MLRRDLFRAWLATPWAGRVGLWWPRAAGGGTEGPDAASVYRKAFGWAKGLRPEDSRWLGEAATIAIDDQRRADALIRRARPALAAIREAAAVDRCSWGVEVLGPDDLCQGHLDVSQIDVIRAACLSARRLARSGRGSEALGDVFAGLTLAHRVGTGGVFIARVLECGGEAPAFRALGRILPELDASALDELARRLDALPAPEPASAAIGPESRFLLGSIRSKLPAIGPRIEREGWADLGFDEEGASVLDRLTGGDRAALLAHLDATGPSFAELARRLDLPRPGCRAALDEFAEAERATWPIASGLVDAAWGVRHVVDRMRALRSMIRAGLALVRDGEAAFRAARDPFGTGTFELERRGTGWVIRSALRDEGRPGTSLEVGEVA